MAPLASCHPADGVGRRAEGNEKRLTIALAGNANVGKSVIFNRLTGSHQTIGNWPGKTVEKAEGTLHFDGISASVIDLPGIYSLSTFSLEELVTREYIAIEKPDVVINVIGASVLERNLFFTLQLLEMEVPLVICLNQMDVAESQGITIDHRKLEAILGTPVVPTVGSKGKGVDRLIQKAMEIARNKQGAASHRPKFSDSLEGPLEKLTGLVESEHLDLHYPSRWVALKLLENDSDITGAVARCSEEVARSAEAMAREIENLGHEPPFAVIAADMYSHAGRIAAAVQRQDAPGHTFSEKLEWLATHRLFGYIVSLAVLVSLLLWTFVVGNSLSNLLSKLLGFIEPLSPRLNGPVTSVLWNGAFGGFVAGITLLIPYVMPFYLVLAMIEDSGILTRVAFMFDNFMHKIGLHGKAIIPLILGYGCNVPAIYTCRVMGTRREKLLAAFAITFIPCTARTIVILGLVAAFINIRWALALYAVDLLLVFGLGRLALKFVPGKSTGLIMEMHPLRLPSLSVIFRQTWARTKSIMYMVFPIYLVGGAVVQSLYAFGWLNPINRALSPVTVTWLGLPAIAGILLVFGIIRKELIVLALVPLYGTSNFLLFLTPPQLLVLAFVGMLYLPCAATFSALVREFGWKPASAISATNLVTAVVLGGLAARLLSLVF